LHPLPENRREGWFLRVIPPILAVASGGLGIASVAAQLREDLGDVLDSEGLVVDRLRVEVARPVTNRPVVVGLAEYLLVALWPYHD
jgi:hypothetical protein